MFFLPADEANCLAKKIVAPSFTSSVGLYLPKIPKKGESSNILYVFETEAFIRSCKIFFNSSELYLFVVLIRSPTVCLAPSTVLRISPIVSWPRPFSFNDFVNISTLVLLGIVFVKSPSNISLFICE